MIVSQLLYILDIILAAAVELNVEFAFLVSGICSSSSSEERLVRVCSVKSVNCYSFSR